MKLAKKITTAAALAAALLAGTAPKAAGTMPLHRRPPGSLHRPGHCAGHDRRR